MRGSMSISSSTEFMMMIDFSQKLRQIQAAKQSVLCVGLDPDPQLLAEGDVRRSETAIAA